MIVEIKEKGLTTQRAVAEGKDSATVQEVCTELGCTVESVEINEHISIPEFGFTVDALILVPNWQPRAEAEFGEIVSYSYSARLGSEISFDIVVLPNAVHKGYVDIVAKLNNDGGTGIPKITITRLGKTLVSEQSMVSVPPIDSLGRNAYVYQMYVPNGWNASEVKWNVSYLGRSLGGGNLGSIR